MKMYKAKSKVRILLVGTLLSILLLFSALLSADIIVQPPANPFIFTSDGTYFHNSGGTAYFCANQTLHLSVIELNSSYVKFNETKFMIDSPNRVNLSLDYMTENISTESEGFDILRFYANTSLGLVYFNLTESFDDDYLLLVDNVFSRVIYLDNTNISFNYTTPSNTFFTVVKPYYFDIVLDGTINNTDKTNLLNNYLSTEDIRADVNNDGVVNYIDRSKIQAMFGFTYI